MGCCGGERERGPPEKKARWEFITLSDFKCTSFWTYIAYGWLWFMGGVSVAVYAVDTFTAINLLAYDKWSSQVQPAVPFRYTKWIFAACIFFSWALLLFELLRAIRVLKRGGVASSYMDPIAASLQCMRGQGWKRFLVFTELTKSKKGTDYVAFFVYFAFQGAIRVILAEGPRQAVNALTLYAVMEAQVVNKSNPTGAKSGIQQFWANIEALADQNLQQSVVYMSMLFTLVIWVFSALCLIGAGILYIVFLWHYIPQRDGRLRIYCRRKIDRRLEKIVAHKVQAAIEDENRRQEKAEKKAELKRQKTGEVLLLPPKIARQPTLPTLGENSEMKGDDGASLARTDTNATMSTLPVYSSRPPTRQNTSNSDRPPMPSRMGTTTSFASDAPLLSNAGYAGDDGRSASPVPSYARQNSYASSFNPPMPTRTGTQSTQASSQRSFTPISRNESTQSRPPPGQRYPIRTNTGYSSQEPNSAISEPSPIDNYGRPLLPPVRANTADDFRPGPQRKDSEVSYFSRPIAPPPGAPGINGMPTFGSVSSVGTAPSRAGAYHPRQLSGGSSFSRPFTPAFTPNQPPQPPNSYEMTSQPQFSSMTATASAPSAKNGQFVAFNPNLHPGSPPPAPQPGAQRSVTLGGHHGQESNYFGRAQEGQRSATAPNDFRAMSSYGSILDDYGAQLPNEPLQHSGRPRMMNPPAGSPRSYTAGPHGGGGWRGGGGQF